MKKYYLFGFLCFLFFFFNYNVSALTTSEYIRNPSNNGIYDITGSYYSLQIRDVTGYVYQNGIFSNYGEGTIIFSFALFNNSVSVPVYNVHLLDKNQHESYCSLGNFNTYYDNTTQITIITATCPVNVTAGIDYIYFSRTSSTGTESLKLGELATFVSKDSTNVDVDVNQDAVINNAIDNNNALIRNIQQSNQAVIDAAHSDMVVSNSNTNDIKNNTKETNDLIKSTDTSGAETSATNFTNNSAFQDNTGLNAIISLPLNMISNLSSTCSPITLTIPYMDQQVTIPCISSILSSKVPTVYNLLKIVINGFIVYRILLDIFNIVKNAKNPDDDRIEVLEL